MKATIRISQWGNPYCRRLLNAILPGMLLLITGACAPSAKSHGYATVRIDILYEDSVSIRALVAMEGSVGFAGSGGVFGSVAHPGNQVRTARQTYRESYPEFRAVGHTATDFFMLSAGDPALLYKTGSTGQMELVYSESGPGVFYDAMAFWDNDQGLAVGDSRDGCLSLIETKDGGASWTQVPCSSLPTALAGEGAFAASNTNIALVGDMGWIATSKGRIFYTPDRGQSWEVFTTPALVEAESQGIFSLDMWDDALGFAIGGDYSNPEINTGNKLRTIDGGRTWQLVADGMDPGYKSCVQFIPGAGGKDLVAIGYTGISYSGDGGDNWAVLSDESFFTIRFVSDSVAYAAGRGRLARLTFR